MPSETRFCLPHLSATSSCISLCPPTMPSPPRALAGLQVPPYQPQQGSRSCDVGKGPHGNEHPPCASAHRSYCPDRAHEDAEAQRAFALSSWLGLPTGEWGATTGIRAWLVAEHCCQTRAYSSESRSRAQEEKERQSKTQMPPESVWSLSATEQWLPSLSHQT